MTRNHNPIPCKQTDVIIFKNGWISPRSPAGHKACKRGGVQCTSIEAAEVWTKANGLSYQTAEQAAAKSDGRRVATYRSTMREEAR